MPVASVPFLAWRPTPARLLVCGFALCAATVMPLLLADDQPNDSPMMFSTHTGAVNAEAGVAIKGFDPVAYFTDGSAVPGDPAITAEVDGAVWRFASDQHRRAFLAHPTRYEPEYGGFCAYGLAQGLKTDIDPAAFSIIGGRLYLNSSIEARTLWRENLLSAIAEADRNWTEVKDRPIIR